ncbi:MAG: ADP-ribosylglycohydrolase family protein [Myxococcales bacterium]|nr:ADP-ribosylglycohydrolase family protein [Myxococcales bacterium]
MPLTPSEIQDRFRASILGFAVGDALGFPLRGVPASSLSRLPALAEDFAPRPRGRFAKGQFTDDTQLLLAAAESVAQERRIEGRSVAAHFAWLWQEGVVLHPPPRLSETAERLLRGAPWMSAGAPMGAKDPAVLSRSVVAGLWHHARPARLPHDAAVLAVITHKDPTCAAASAAMAKAVSLGLSGEQLAPADFCQRLSAAASESDLGLAEELRYLPRVLGWEVERALAQLRKVGVPASELHETDGLPAHVVPVLLTGLYAALKVPHDFREALTLVLRCGGEADVAAACSGAVLGSQLGSDAIPARLRRNVLYADHLVRTSDRLFHALNGAPAEVAAQVGVRRRG